MARKERLTRHNVVLFEGDMASLQTMHPQRASLLIRSLVRKFILENRPIDEAIAAEIHLEGSTMTDIVELYDRDPFSNSDKDIDEVIKDLRGKMRNFKAVGVPAKSSQRTPPKADPTLELDIDLT